MTAKRGHSAHSQNGATLIVVLIFSLVSAAIIAQFLARTTSSSQIAGDLVRRKRAFYATDGMSRIVINELQNYLVSNPNPSTSDLQDADLTNAADVPGYSIDLFDIVSTGDGYDGAIPNGAFEGLYAHLMPVSFHLIASDDRSGTRSDISLMALLGQISMFQFFVFSDRYLEIYPGPAMTVNPGRVHANNDVCIGSYSEFKLEYVTSAGRIMASDARCRRTTGNGVYIWDGLAYVWMDADNSNACTDCDGSGQDWESYAINTWKRHAMDTVHGVSALRLAGSSEAETQAGMDAQGDLVLNQNSTRLLVDPVRSADSSVVKEQRFAWKADIRIINGVWYKNDDTWPGLPIWSDHPGSFTTQGEEGVEPTGLAVGQSDLRTARNWSTVPYRYSYYEYDTTNARIADNTQGVISYGTLARKTGPIWKPGFWAKGANRQTYTDVDGINKLKFCSACLGSNPCSAAIGFRDASAQFCQVTSGATLTYSLDGQYLQATTSGFYDYRVATDTAEHGPILSTNFDLAEFAAAMQDTTPGELGSYFSGGADFNGIIYVTHTWTDSMAGIPDETATLWPAQGALVDATQIVTRSGTMLQRALPFPLCSDSLGYIAGGMRQGFSRPASDGNTSNGFEPVFTVPSCDDAISPTSRPSALRVINGSNLSHTLFPAGITVATNLPVYVVGGLNTASNTAGFLATPWMPVLVAADAVTLLSNNWDDQNARWDHPTGSTPVASATTFNFQMLGGSVETVDNDHYSGGMENFPRFLENWNNILCTAATSFVVGYASVYQRQPWVGSSSVYSPPIRNWSFDLHLKALANQPPGAPRVSVASISYLDQMAQGSD